MSLETESDSQTLTRHIRSVIRPVMLSSPRWMLRSPNPVSLNYHRKTIAYPLKVHVSSNVCMKLGCRFAFKRTVTVRKTSPPVIS